MRATILLATAVIATAGTASTALAATKSVKVGDNYFIDDDGVPKLTVKRGTIVKWVWRGRAPHNVVATKGPKKFKSSIMRSGSYSAKPHTPGTYAIVCTLHLPKMKMTLVVK